MIRVKVMKRDKIEDGVLQDLTRKNKFSIVDCNKPTPNEIKELATIADIPESEIKRNLQSKFRPVALDVGNYFELGFKVNTPVRGNPRKFSQVTFYTSHRKNTIIIIHKDKIATIDTTLKEEDKTHLTHFYNSKTKLLFKLIGEFIHEAGLALEKIEDEVDAIEKGVFKKSDHNFLSNIFTVKKALIIFHKEFVANREALTNLAMMFNIDKQDVKALTNLKTDSTQVIETIGIFRELINSSIELHLSAGSNNMNQIMKRMTSFGAIIMIPTLIASIWGMNFGEIPFFHWYWGFYAVVGFIFLLVIFFWIYFAKKDWL